MILCSTPAIAFRRFLLNDLSPRAFNFSEGRSGFAATATLAPSRALPGGELPPVLHQYPDEIKNGEAFKNSEQGGRKRSARLHCSARAAGSSWPLKRHVRSIVNSAHECVRVCLRNARVPLFVRREAGQRCASNELREQDFGAHECFGKQLRFATWGQAPRPRKGRTGV